MPCVGVACSSSLCPWCVPVCSWSSGAPTPSHRSRSLLHPSDIATTDFFLLLRLPHACSNKKAETRVGLGTLRQCRVENQSLQGVVFRRSASGFQFRLPCDCDVLCCEGRAEPAGTKRSRVACSRRGGWMFIPLTTSTRHVSHTPALGATVGIFFIPVASPRSHRSLWDRSTESTTPVQNRRISCASFVCRREASVRYRSPSHPHGHRFQAVLHLQVQVRTSDDVIQRDVACCKFPLPQRARVVMSFGSRLTFAGRSATCNGVLD